MSERAVNKNAVLRNARDFINSDNTAAGTLAPVP